MVMMMMVRISRFAIATTPSPSRCRKAREVVVVVVVLDISRLTVRFLESRAGAASSELLGLASTRIRDEKTSVVAHQGVLDLGLGLFVNNWRKEVVMRRE